MNEQIYQSVNQLLNYKDTFIRWETHAQDLSQEYRLEQEQQNLDNALKTRQAIIQQGQRTNTDVSLNLKEIDQRIEVYNMNIARIKQQIEKIQEIIGRIS